MVGRLTTNSSVSISATIYLLPKPNLLASNATQLVPDLSAQVSVHQQARAQEHQGEDENRHSGHDGHDDVQHLYQRARARLRH